MLEGSDGSSPLTRGARCCSPIRSRGSRLIPAHAGSTGQSASDTRRCPAHPRSRGEHLEQSTGAIEAVGSSPLTRGAPNARLWSASAPRLIPAHAGSTWGSTPWLLARAAHPRSHGEHLLDAGRTLIQGGSSPLTRGALELKGLRVAVHRLIPAHAGSTEGKPFAYAVKTAHPRSRGEHRRAKPGRNRERGLIPAHAGSTAATSRMARSRTAHPRSRGEHVLEFACRQYQVGSSPLTRGAPIAAVFVPADLRLIPAHAGSTGAPGFSWMRIAAHPRSRGEHSCAVSSLTCPAGSSPLTRGAPSPSSFTISTGRLIPAHAGSTTKL